MYICTCHGHESVLLSLNKKCHVTFNSVKTTWYKVVKALSEHYWVPWKSFPICYEVHGYAPGLQDEWLWSIMHYSSGLSWFLLLFIHISRAIFSFSRFCTTSCRGEWQHLRGLNCDSLTCAWSTCIQAERMQNRNVLPIVSKLWFSGQLAAVQQFPHSSTHV